MTPGEYLQKRREAANVTREQIGPISTAVEMEGGRILVSDVLLYEAAGVGLSRAILFDLVSGPPTDPVCQVCGCSEFDPCCDCEEGTCAWVAADLCSACLDKVEGAAA